MLPSSRAFLHSLFFDFPVLNISRPSAAAADVGLAVFCITFFFQEKRQINKATFKHKSDSFNSLLIAGPRGRRIFVHGAHPCLIYQPSGATVAIPIPTFFLPTSFANRQ